jgi:flagellar hook assembly protein FlgD
MRGVPVRRRIRTIHALLAISAAAAVAAWAGSASIFINYPSISPDGDGVRDEMTVTVTLSSQVDTLLVTVRDKTTENAYDTLINEAPAAEGDRSAMWGGTDWTGTVLPEGQYDLHLYESTGGSGESLLRTVVIDLTSPLVNIDRIEPGVYSPGWPDDSASVIVYFTVSGWETGASARMTVRDPDGGEETDPVDVQGDGEWSGVWKPATTMSGFHTITVSVDDEAGNSDADSGTVFVDSDPPELEILTEMPSNTREAPDEMIGRAYDISGISSMELSWTGIDNVESDRFPADSTWFEADTLYWRFDTPDSVNGNTGHVEGGYKLRAFASDPFDRQSNKTLSFMLDRTPPSPPLIEDLPGRVIHASLDLYIQYDDDTDSLLVYRQGTGPADSTWFLTSVMSPGDPIEVTLSEGLNEFRAIGRDDAGNTSALSNTVYTTLDPTTGITYPEVFRSPGSFQIVSAETASSVTLEIYDIRGERMRKITVPGPGTSFDIAWDLTNDDGETVRNGPCLVVITIDHSGGRTVDKAFVAVVR